MTSNGAILGAGIRGTVIGQAGAPMTGIDVHAQNDESAMNASTGPNGEFFLLLPSPGAYTLVVGDDVSTAIPLPLNKHDLAVVEWQVSDEGPESSLPLAEIRSVDLIWGDSLTFSAESPWDHARFRWSVSGGTLEGEGERVVWAPPSEPGRYLLQVIADWGRTGLAVDSVVLVVRGDGTFSVE
jgi:hypothetical protein